MKDVKKLIFEGGKEATVIGGMTIQRNKKEPIRVEESQITEEEFEEQFNKN